MDSTTIRIERKLIHELLRQSLSKIHISCDVWSSPNKKPIFGIIAHFVTKDRKLKHVVLAMVEFKGSHNRTLLGDAIIEVIDD